MYFFFSEDICFNIEFRKIVFSFTVLSLHKVLDCFEWQKCSFYRGEKKTIFVSHKLIIHFCSLYIFCQMAESRNLYAEEKEAEVKLLERSVEELECTINVLEDKVSVLCLFFFGSILIQCSSLSYQ